MGVVDRLGADPAEETHAMADLLHEREDVEIPRRPQRLQPCVHRPVRLDRADRTGAMGSHKCGSNDGHRPSQEEGQNTGPCVRCKCLGARRADRGETLASVQQQQRKGGTRCELKAPKAKQCHKICCKADNTLTHSQPHAHAGTESPPHLATQRLGRKLERKKGSRRLGERCIGLARPVQ